MKYIALIVIFDALKQLSDLECHLLKCPVVKCDGFSVNDVRERKFTNKNLCRGRVVKTLFVISTYPRNVFRIKKSE